MNLLSERLNWAMHQARERGNPVLAADVARAAKVSGATLTHWMSNSNGISAAKARLVGEFLGVDALWLETGKGQPQLTSPQAKSGNVSAYDVDDGVPEDMVLVKELRVEFSAGPGKQACYELVEDSIPASYRRDWFQKEGMNPDKVVRFRVAGRSMEPFLYAQDTILVNTGETNIVDGKLYAIRYGDELRVKYLSRRLDGTMILRSVNPDYKDEEVPPSLADEHITVIGRVRDKSGRGGL